MLSEITGYNLEKFICRQNHGNEVHWEDIKIKMSAINKNCEICFFNNYPYSYYGLKNDDRMKYLALVKNIDDVKYEISKNNNILAWNIRDDMIKENNFKLKITPEMYKKMDDSKSEMEKIIPTEKLEQLRSKWNELLQKTVKEQCTKTLTEWTTDLTENNYKLILNPYSYFDKSVYIDEKKFDQMMDEFHNNFKKIMDGYENGSLTNYHPIARKKMLLI